MSEGISTVKTGQRTERNAESISMRSTIVGSSKADKNRQKIKAEIDNARPQFGSPGTAVDANGETYQKSGFAKVPDGRTIVFQPMGKSYSVYHVTKGGNTGGWERYTNEKKAIAAQKRMYEKELAKVKKRYNL